MEFAPAPGADPPKTAGGDRPAIRDYNLLSSLRYCTASAR
jgi:hypothetical protein